MSRYIDADALKQSIPMYQGEYPIMMRAVITAINAAPTVDVVEVVRCKDCKHLTVVNNESIYARCEKTGYIFWSFETDTREHFCAYGERREEDEG